MIRHYCVVVYSSFFIVVDAIVIFVFVRSDSIFRRCRTRVEATYIISSCQLKLNRMVGVYLILFSFIYKIDQYDLDTKDSDSLVRM